MAVKNDNVFTAAKTIVEAPKPRKKGEKEETTIKDLEVYSAMDHVEKTLKGIKDSLYRESIKDQMYDVFVKEILTSHTKPENIKGIEGKSNASLEFRKRSSTSPLAASEVTILKQHGIRTETITLSPAKEEAFQMSPEVMKALEKHPKLAGKLSDALISVLGNVPELKGKDLILRVAPKEAETVEIVTEYSFEDAAKLTNVDVIKQIYKAIVTPTVGKPIFHGNFNDALTVLQKAKIDLKVTKK